MKQSRFSDSQIIAVLKQAEGGSPVPELCWVHILEQREHPFWANVNSDSEGT